VAHQARELDQTYKIIVKPCIAWPGKVRFDILYFHLEDLAIVSGSELVVSENSKVI
jgi:hypothetical protein